VREQRICGSQPYLGDAQTTGAICTYGSLGQATIVLGGIMARCIYLAEALGDTTWLDSLDSMPTNNTDIITYSITCTVDMASALEYREVQLTLQQSADSPIAFSRSLSTVSNEPCSPMPSLTPEPQNLDKLIALATVAPYQSLSIPWANWARPLTITQGSGASSASHTH
jgi:hypothetical protein